ncbi:lipocalin family protein [Mucilaginibacter sp.]|uniref:lipocalin family protein n=1 Tax=Mucilaginibacter sp. TaxID=1882438 RepID=UPI0025CE6C06|nr:lipocalin family protein [Mucilaginibacter sp.]
MKTIALLFVSFLSLVTALPNKTVSYVDSKKFGGTWYSLYSIPTMFDKGSRQTTTHYTLNKDGYYDVVTTCIKNEKGDLHTVKSKIFRVDGASDGQMKAQFLWPFKVDYWVVELAPDYSWAVVGHPDHKFLFIMARKPEMDAKLHEEIVAKCKAMGYPVETLVSQQFPGAR